MRVAVTGSGGFLGKHLINQLNSSGHDIIEVDLIKGFDITDWESISSISGFDVLVHLAALSFVPKAFENPAEFYRTNVIGTVNALELCRLNNARIIFTSSYVYGDPDYLPIDEGHPLKAFNPYAQSKLMGEDLCKAYHRDFDVPVCIFRPFNIYGSGQASHFLIPLILNQAKVGMVQLKDPRPKRDFIHINDVVSAYVKAVELNFQNAETYNLGSGTSTSIGDIIEILKELSEEDIQVEFTNEHRKNEVLETVADISLAKEILKWKPKIVFRNGISELLKESLCQ
jgi:nucleoside-diphosphate-sugar epimerase